MCRRKKTKWIWLAALMAVLILGRISAVKAFDVDFPYMAEDASAEISKPVVPLPFGNSNAKGMVLMDGKTGRLLFGVILTNAFLWPAPPRS